MAYAISSKSAGSGPLDRMRLPLQAQRMAVAVFVAMCAAGALITWLVYASEASNRQARLDQELIQAARLIELRIEQHVALLTATRAFLATSQKKPDRATFSTFVRGLGLRDEYSGLQGVGLSLIVRPDGEREVSRGILDDYGFTRSVWPQSTNELRTAIVLLEPADRRNLAAIGYDMATEERRRAAMLRALRTGEPSGTAPITLVQEITPDQQSGILIYLPLTSADGQIDGFVYSPIRMGNLFRAAMSNHRVPLEMQVQDAGDLRVPLYSTPDFDHAATTHRPMAELSRSIAGREWVFTAVATESFVATERPRFTALTALAFALLAVASGLAAQAQRTALRGAQALDAEVERRVRQKDFLLREMSHRIKNSISRAIAIVRQSSSSSATKEEFVESVTIRLRAMAAVQDLLIASGNDRADLHDLLTSEMQQLYGGKMRPHVMEGRPVSLDSQQTLALGLAVHELATNSLKYGAGASPDGELKVAWKVETLEGVRQLSILWDEFVPEDAVIQPAIAATRTGLGNKLIDKCIRTDLGGTVARYAHAEGVTVEMRIPLG